MNKNQPDVKKSKSQKKKEKKKRKKEGEKQKEAEEKKTSNRKRPFARPRSFNPEPKTGPLMSRFLSLPHILDVLEEEKKRAEFFENEEEEDNEPNMKLSSNTESKPKSAIADQKYIKS